MPGCWPDLWVLHGIASGVERGYRQTVHLNVIRMAVAAVLIIARHDVRTDAPDQAYQTSSRLLEVSLGQAVRMVIGVAPHHARITIAQDMQFLHPQMLAGTFELGCTYIPEFGLDLLRIHLRIHHFAFFPTRGGY